MALQSIFEEVYKLSASRLEFSPRVGHSYAVGNGWRVGAQFLDKALEESTFAERLPNQVLIEAKDSLPAEERNKITAEILSSFEQNGVPFFVIFSGGKSYHIHVFFHPKIVEELAPWRTSEGKYRTRFGEDVSFPLLALFYFRERFSEDVFVLQNLDEHLLKAKTCMFPLPNKKRNDKAKKTALEDLHPKNTADPEQFFYNPHDFVDFLKERALKQERYFSDIDVDDLESVVQKGAPKGSRDSTAYKLYFRLRLRGISHEQAKEKIQEFLHNSEPKGVWDKEKEQMFSKVDKYWKKYFEKFVQANPKVAKKIKQKESQKEVVGGVVDKLIQSIRFVEYFQSPDGFSVFIHFNSIIVELPKPEGQKSFWSKLLFKLLDSLYLETGDEAVLEWANELRQLSAKEREPLCASVFKKILSSAPKRRTTLRDAVEKALEQYFFDKVSSTPEEKLMEEVLKIQPKDLVEILRQMNIKGSSANKFVARLFMLEGNKIRRRLKEMVEEYLKKQEESKKALAQAEAPDREGDELSDEIKIFNEDFEEVI